MRAEPPGPRAAHRRSDPVRLRLAARREHDTRADDHRSATEARVVALLDRRVERVEVGVEDRGRSRSERMFAQPVGLIQTVLRATSRLFLRACME